MSLMANRPAPRGPEGILREIQVSLLECKVCFEKFTNATERRPQNLSCGHVLCRACTSALAQPLLRKLECPFCRRLCSLESTSHCRVLGDLQEILLMSCVTPHVSVQASSGLRPAAVRYLGSWGGWGALINPSGVAMLAAPGSAVVVHDGEKRVVVLSEDGTEVHTFGKRTHNSAGVVYPVDVAVTTGGNIVVTDAGDGAVKVFTSGGAHLVTITDHFELPWGVDAKLNGHILVSDVQAGTLSLMKVDYKQAVLLECGPVVSDLRGPKSVACCRASGSTAVVEHLSAESPRTHGLTRLTVFTDDFHILHQTDSFSLMLHSTVHLNVSAVTFDGNGGLLAVDSDRGLIWSLEMSERNLVRMTPVVSDRLVRPVAAVSNLNKLMVLDGGDHTRRVFTLHQSEERNQSSSQWKMAVGMLAGAGARRWICSRSSPAWLL
ncbi:E3 ubiquitin-protein ligase NHLRC1-like [Synchiropus picturatus]